MKRRTVILIHLLRGLARFELNVKSNKTRALRSGLAEYATRLIQKCAPTQTVKEGIQIKPGSQEYQREKARSVYAKLMVEQN